MATRILPITTDLSILRKRSIEVEKPNWKFVAQLAATLLAQKNGVGLSAIQVGVPARIFVLAWPPEGWSAFIDPVILKSEGECESTEGCLSIPGVIRKIKRFQHVELAFTDNSENRVAQSFDGLLAVAIQHEVDHLNGILLTDHPAVP
jgi:peptide deformylase